MHGIASFPHRGRSGIALVYLAIVMSLMMGLCSLAVDMARYHTAHQAMYNAVLAAARAGAAEMPGGTASSVSTAATAIATSNYVDGHSIASSNVTVDCLSWTSASNYTVQSAANFSQANSVRVTITYSVPLVFARVFGLGSKTATEVSVAKVVVNTDTPTVYAAGNIWLANEPSGTHASQADPGYTTLHGNSDHQYPYDIAGTPNKTSNGSTNSAANYSTSEPYSSPVKVGFTVTPGATIRISNTTGSSSYDHDTAPFIDATGNSGVTGVCNNNQANNVGEHGISDCTMPMGSMNAVFTGSGAPDSIATVPPCLNFSTSASRDYAALRPKLQQAFYTGDGQTSANQQQEIVVPAGATYMFMGVMDAWEWNNNRGAFNCTVTQTYITTVQ